MFIGKYTETRSHTDGFRRNNANYLELKGDMQALPIFVNYGVLTHFGGVRKINCYLSVADSGLKAARKKVFVLQ